MSVVRRRMTKQRSVIYDILCADYTHPTAEVIYGKTQKVLPNISLGTVYRNLNLLAEDGMIKYILMLISALIPTLSVNNVARSLIST